MDWKMYRGLEGEMIMEGLWSDTYRRIEGTGAVMRTKQNDIMKKMAKEYIDLRKKVMEKGVYKIKGRVEIGKENKWKESIKRIENVMSIMHPNIKIHKDPMTLRPIVDRSKSIFSMMGCIINNILREIKDKWDLEYGMEVNVKRVEDLVDELNVMEYDKELEFYRLDVRNMFTEVNTEKLLGLIDELIDEGIYNKEILMEMISYGIFKTNFFKFNKTLYTQGYGLQMGANTSIIYTEIYMDVCLNRCKGLLEKKCGVRKLWKYVDDILVS